MGREVGMEGRAEQFGEEEQGGRKEGCKNWW